MTGKVGGDWIQSKCAKRMVIAALLASDQIDNVIIKML
jgi:hypothetical protein